MTPKNLEILLFLKLNKKYWDIDDVKSLYFDLMSSRINKEKDTDEYESDEE